MLKEICDGRIYVILLLRYHRWGGGLEECVCCSVMYWFLIVLFDYAISSSHVIVSEWVIYTSIKSEIKVGEPHVVTFIATDVATVEKLPVLTQIL